MLRIADAAWTDLRHAVRRIVHSPWLSFVVVITLALAIAANTTIFSLLKPTVLRKLAAPDPDSLVAIGGLDERSNTYLSIHLESFRALQAGQRSFAQLGAFTSSVVRVESEGLAVDTGVEGVTPEYFDVLGFRARAGRVFAPADDLFGATAVITHRFAQRMFGDRSAIGRSIVVDGRPVEIIGVLDSGFVGVRMDGGDDLFLPLGFLRNTVLRDPAGVTRAQSLVGRLAPGATVTSARAEVLGRWPAIRAAVAAAVPTTQRAVVENQKLTVESFAQGFSGVRDRYGNSLRLVMGLALALLAVGCVNLSGLMLARGLTRQHEFAVRVALGVSRARLVQQTVIDGLLLSLIALVVALPLAWWASAILTSMVSVARAIPLADTAPELSTMAIAAAVAIAAGLSIGILPARKALSSSMDDVLRGRGTAQRLRGLTRGVLITQIAVSMILVVGAGLFGRTLTHLYANDVTAREHEVIFTRIARAPLQRGTPLPDGYYQNLQQQLQDIPGADLAAFSLMYPGWLSAFGPLPFDTVIERNGAQAPAVSDSVSPSFFEVFGIERLRGRDFTWNESPVANVIIVNAALAQRLFGKLDVIGEPVQISSGGKISRAEIVGVVANASVKSIRERDAAAYYRPMPPLGFSEGPMAHVRVVGDVAAVRRGYVDVVNAQRQHFVRALFTMSMWVDNSVMEQRLIAGMASVAASLAMALAAIGLFGLLAYSVSSRVREIGVRMSVGATAREVVRMIVREGLVVVIPGVAIGIPLALSAAWLLRSQLHGVSATDPWTVAAAAILFTATAAVACWLPARRAARIQPIEALRQE